MNPSYTPPVSQKTSTASGGAGRPGAAQAGAKPARWCRLARGLERTLALIGLALLLYLPFFETSTIVSNSMTPTLTGNGGPGSDWVLTEKLSYFFRNPRRWEVLAFQNHEGVRIMKRVVGLPGETVALHQDGTFLINNTPIERPAVLRENKYYAVGRLLEKTGAVSDGGYFVLGDDSRDSDDSRYNPGVKPDALRGRPWLILWPPQHMGFVNP